MTTIDYDSYTLSQHFVHLCLHKSIQQLPHPVTGGLTLDVPYVQYLDCVPVRIEVADSFWTLRGVRRVVSGVELIATYECYRIGRFT